MKNILLSNSWVKEEKLHVGKCFKLDDNEKRTHHVDVAKAVFGGKYMTLSTYIKKE